MQRGRSPVSLSDLVKAQLLRPGQEVSFRKSPSITGVVTDSGTISVSGTEYGSPSTAAKAAADGVSTNGWLAWSVRRDDGWSTLAELRDQLLNR
jgi:hypothetical protein